MPANIDLSKISGVGPEQALIEQYLFDSAGNRRDLAEVEREIGWNQATLAIVELGLREKLSAPSTRGYPPRIFISYRRESGEHIEWCRKLAQALLELGYRVFLDSLEIWSETPTVEIVGSFIQKLGDADIILPVLTEGYLGSGHATRTWIFEEWERIARLRYWGFVEIIAIHRSGVPQSSGFVKISDAVDKTIDLTDNSIGFDPLIQLLGSNDRMALTDDESRALASDASFVVESVKNQLRPNGRLDTTELLPTMERLSKFAGTEEYWLAHGWFAVAAKDEDSLLHAANQLLAMNAGLSSTVSIARALWFADLDADAVGLLAEASEGPCLWRQRARLLLADIFERLGLLNSALNHIRWCQWAGSDRDRPDYWGLKLDEADLAQRKVDLVAAIEHQPADPNGEIVCSKCSSEFLRSKRVYVLCGAFYRQDGDERCYFCHALIVPVENLEFCPTCRIVFEGSSLGEEDTNVYLIPREPAGRFSVVGPRLTVETSNLALRRPLGSSQNFVEY